jgi:hypothetical protein
MTDSELAQEVIVVGHEEQSLAQGVAEVHGVQVRALSAKGIEPTATVALILIGTPLAVATVSRVLEQRKGGQVIDLRPGAPRPFYRTPDVSYGLVVVVSTDGQVLVHVKRPDDMFTEVMGILRDWSHARPPLPSGAAAEEIRALVGDNASVEQSPLGGQ